MRRLILLLVLVTAIFVTGCENTEDNSPALQGQIDEFFFKAADARASQNDDGTYTIQGITQDETMTIHLVSHNLGTYQLGSGYSNFASFEDSAGNMYTTSPNGSGEVEITDRCISCGWLTGTFKFSAIQEGVDTLAVQKGFFFKVSFLNGDLPSDAPVPTDGALFAEVDGEDYEANSVAATLENGSIKIEGFKDDDIIRIVIPADGVSGNYNYPTDGFSASIINNGVEDPAVSGLISINFNNTTTRITRVFFSFVTESGVQVTMGNTRVDY